MSAITKNTTYITHEVKDQNSDIDSLLQQIEHADSPSKILLQAQKVLKGIDDKSRVITAGENIFKALTTREFENGMLLSLIVDQEYKTFAIDFMHKLQKEYQCDRASEQALCELASVNYTRTLELQRIMNNYLTKNGKTKLELDYVTIISKELDRANRHFLATIQTLKTFKQMPINVTIKNAVIAEQQIIQSNTYG